MPSPIERHYNKYLMLLMYLCRVAASVDSVSERVGVASARARAPILHPSGPTEHDHWLSVDAMAAERSTR